MFGCHSYVYKIKDNLPFLVRLIFRASETVKKNCFFFFAFIFGSQSEVITLKVFSPQTNYV